jgi:hypothetical protein
VDAPQGFSTPSNIKPRTIYGPTAHRWWSG